jgi:hypothetical protein
MALPQREDQMPHIVLSILQSTALLHVLALRRVSFLLKTSISVMYIISPGLMTLVARHPNPNAIAIVFETTRNT